jgi:hypothetical protein
MQSWLRIRKADHESLKDDRGWAHCGRLSGCELQEIYAEVNREESDIWKAVIDAASSGSR